MRKRSICSLLLVINIFICIAQNMRTHIVQRGESLENIAEMYGITIAELKQSNEYLNTYFYVGQQLNIPTPVSQEKADVYVAMYRMKKYLLEGENEENKGKYTSAQKIYEEGLESLGENAYLHFCMGRCYYKMRSWKKAVRELYIALQANDNTLYDVTDEAKAMLADAREKRAEQLEERRAMWSEFGANLAAAVVVTTNAYMQSKASSISSGKTQGETSSYSSSSDDEDNTTGVTSSSQSNKRCRRCLGSGKCSTCNGKGTYFSNEYGIARYYECPNCTDGKCSSCNGTGYK